MARRSCLLIVCWVLGIGGGALGGNRTACFDPFPVFNPRNPGACFLDTDLGVFLNLDDGEEFVQVETFGDPDDFIQWRKDGSRYSHQSELHAVISYCPPDVTGLDCTRGFGLPGPGAWLGEGQWYVNSELDADLEFTCPSVIFGRGTVTDPDSGIAHSVSTRMIRVQTPQGACRDIANTIEVEPLD